MTKGKRGGKRKGAGRKPSPPTHQRKPYTVRLTNAEVALLRQHGPTVQDGIRTLIRKAT